MMTRSAPPGTRPGLALTEPPGVDSDPVVVLVSEPFLLQEQSLGRMGDAVSGKTAPKSLFLEQNSLSSKVELRLSRARSIFSSSERTRAEMAVYWQHLGWMAYAAAGITVWRFIPLAVLRLVAAFTRDDRRHRQCMEVLALSRRHAAATPRCLACRDTQRPSTPKLIGSRTRGRAGQQQPAATAPHGTDPKGRP